MTTFNGKHGRTGASTAAHDGVVRDPETTKVLQHAYRALRSAKGDAAKLAIIANAATDLENIGDDGSDAIAELSEVAIDTHRLDPDAVQRAIAAGINRALDARANKADHGHHRNGTSHGSEGSQLSLPLDFIEAASWQNVPVPVRRWLAHNRVPIRHVTLLYGDGAAGKTTIALQLAIGTVRTGEWLGAVIEETGRTLFVTAEEDKDEVQRRLADIIRQRDLSFRDIAGLSVLCLSGEDAVLGAVDRNTGIIKPTPLYHRLLKEVQARQPKLIVIEAAADVYAGEENDRAQVRQFVTLLRKLAIAADGAVVLIAHPSLSGISSGTGTSGSTGWSNSARSRLYFTSVKDGDEQDPNLRELRVMKSNYGPPNEVVRARYHCGAFVMETGKSPVEQAAAHAKVDDVFLRCLDIKNAQGIAVSPKQSRSGAAAMFSKMQEAKGITPQALAQSQERLLSGSRIKAEPSGSPSRGVSRLVRANVASPPST